LAICPANKIARVELDLNMFRLYFKLVEKHSKLNIIQEYNDIVQFHIDSNMNNILVLISMLILNEKKKNESDTHLENFIKVFLKSAHELNERLSFTTDDNIHLEDSSSCNSSVCSMLGFEVTKKKTFFFFIK
jgi:hypothetical protein